MANCRDEFRVAAGRCLTTLRAIVEDRRTNMLVDRDREVSEDIVRDLCELAMWAPNHKRTWPWRFAAFSGDGRVRLGEACAEDLIAGGSDDEFKIQKVRSKYPSAVRARRWVSARRSCNVS